MKEVAKQLVGEQRASLTPGKKAVIIPPLENPATQEEKQASQLIAVQFVLVCVVAVVSYGLAAAPEIALAVWIGGAVSILNSLLLAWRMSRARRLAITDAHQQVRLLFAAAIERFLLVMLALGLLMVTTRMPLAILGGFVAGQATMIFTRLYLQLRVR